MATCRSSRSAPHLEVVLQELPQQLPAPAVHQHFELIVGQLTGPGSAKKTVE